MHRFVRSPTDAICVSLCDRPRQVLERRGRAITLQIWDIAGQGRCGSMTRVYYRAAVGALVVHGGTDRQSFAGVETRKDDIDFKVLMRE